MLRDIVNEKDESSRVSQYASQHFHLTQQHLDPLGDI